MTRSYTRDMPDNYVPDNTGRVEDLHPSLQRTAIETCMEHALEGISFEDAAEKVKSSSYWNFDDDEIDDSPYFKSCITGIPKKAKLKRMMGVMKEMGYYNKNSLISNVDDNGLPLDDIVGIRTEHSIFFVFLNRLDRTYLPTKEYSHFCWKPALVEDLVLGDDKVRIRELVTGQDLIDHGTTMDHCIASFLPQCWHPSRNHHILEGTNLETGESLFTGVIQESIPSNPQYNDPKRTFKILEVQGPSNNRVDKNLTSLVRIACHQMGINLENGSYDPQESSKIRRFLVDQAEEIEAPAREPEYLSLAYNPE